MDVIDKLALQESRSALKGRKLFRDYGICQEFTKYLRNIDFIWILIVVDALAV